MALLERSRRREAFDHGTLELARLTGTHLATVHTGRNGLCTARNSISSLLHGRRYALAVGTRFPHRRHRARHSERRQA
jgi:hypothetical protein